MEEVPYCFLTSSIKFQGHTRKITDFDPNWAVSGMKFQLEYTDRFEMMHRAWSIIEEVPYGFSMSSIKFQGHTGQKIADFDPNWTFPDCSTQILIHQWILNNAQKLT